MSYHLQIALARERQSTLLREAEAFRRAGRARQAPARQPVRCGTGRGATRWLRWWRLIRRTVPSTATPR